MNQKVPLWAVLLVILFGLGLGALAPTQSEVVQPVAESQPAEMVVTTVELDSVPPTDFSADALLVDLSPLGTPDMPAGRAYSEVGGSGLDGVEAVLALPEAPATPVAAAADAPADREATREPRPSTVRSTPVRRYSAAQAASMPLLAVSRGLRVVFHETKSGASSETIAGIEGDWAVPGQCRVKLQLDLAQPVRTAGEVRGIGTREDGSSWEWAPAVPIQGCENGSRLWRPGGPASERDREDFADLGGAYAPGSLGRILRVDGEAWLHYRGPAGGGRVVVASKAGGSWQPVWVHEVGSTESVEMLGSYRRDGALEVWLLESGDGYGRRFLRVVRTKSGVWDPDVPAPLRG